VKFVLIAVLSLSILACAEFEALKNAVGSYGSEAADDTLGVAIWQICNASSVGAVKRRFKTDDELAAMKVICGEI